MNTNLAEIENRLWSAADELRANSRLRASEYSTPVLGLIFLRYADHKFTQTEQEIIAKPLRAGADGPIQEHNTKRAACFTCQRTLVSSTSSVYRRAKTLGKLSLTL